METVTAIVFITGFAIQQALQLLDPLITVGILRYKNSRSTKDLPGGMADTDFKKTIMACLSFVLGAVTAGLTGVRPLSFAIDIKNGSPGVVGDFFVTALVIGAGTEGMNTLLKYFGYVKDARKPEPTPLVEISITPTTAAVARQATFQFLSRVNNSSNTAVTWKVLHGNGGTIDANGLYTAPNNSGTFQVVATSVADASKFATASVTVA